MAIDLTEVPKGVRRGPKLDLAKADEKEKASKLELPKDLKAMLAQSNGLVVKSEKGKVTFLPQAKILDVWAGLNKTYDTGQKDDKHAEPDKGVANLWWSKDWVPFAKINGADFYCIDQAPTPGGRKGQVILFRTGKPRRQVVAKSLEEFVEKVLQKMK